MTVGTAPCKAATQGAELPYYPSAQCHWTLTFLRYIFCLWKSLSCLSGKVLLQHLTCSTQHHLLSSLLHLYDAASQTLLQCHASLTAQDVQEETPSTHSWQFLTLLCLLYSGGPGKCVQKGPFSSHTSAHNYQHGHLLTGIERMHRGPPGTG